MGFELIFVMLTVGFAAALMFDGTDDEVEQVEEQPEQEENGLVLSYTGSDIITGGDGNDTLSDTDESVFGDQTSVYLEGGDDYAYIDEPTFADLHGGAGDDTLISRNVTVDLFGDDGNDTLTGVSANALHGGVGDDLLSVDHTFELNDKTTEVFGGDGEDTIQVIAEIGRDDPGVGGLVASGGAGNDVFDVTLRLEEESEFRTEPINGEDPEILNSGTVLLLQDFTPGEDVLTIEVERAPGNEDRDMLAAEIVPFQNGAQSGSELVMRFAASEDALEVVSSIRFLGAQRITLDDVAFVQA